MDSFEPDGNGVANGNGATNGNGAQEALPPPPPVIPPNVVPVRAEGDQPPEPVKKKVTRVPIARRGLANKGQKIQLLTNHFKVGVNNVDGHFFHYSVSLAYEDGRPVDGKGVGRKVIDRVQETYDTELAGKDFAYDGEKSLFTVGPLPRNKLEFTVVLEDVISNRNNGNSSPNGHGSPNEGDRKRMRRPYQSKTFKVEISFAAKIPMQAIANALRGQESENSQEALRVLDIILRQHAAKQGCLLVRQSFFHNDPKNFADVGGGVLGCRGFHSSFRTSQGGLSLNIDVSTTMIIQPGPVVDFLIANQNVRDPFSLDWSKAKRTLKNLRIKTSPANQEFKITGLSEKTCKDQMFTLKQRGNDADGEPQTIEVTVYDYFVNHRGIELRYSGDLPCINVGKPKRPTFFPLELCSLVSLQRYTKALSTLQRASLVEKSRQKPQERMKVLSEALKCNNYDSEPLLRSCGISISTSFTQVDGRVLPAPRLKVGNGEDFFPRNGRWNFNNKKLVQPTKIERWAVVNFSARCDTQSLVRDLIKCGDLKGIVVSSRQWPLISKYRASVRTQSPKVEMIDSLFKKTSETEDDGIMRELLLDFYTSSGKRKPDQIIIFRDGVSESQFNQVLNIELDQIIESCKFLDEKWNPKFVVIVAQKNHHTKFFQPGSPDNVPPGTVIDNKVCHPRNNDFYLCAHAGMIGTTRPTHYHVLLDDVGFSADDLQELVHSLSYVYQRSTTAISVVAPICYAHLAATQMGQFMKFEELSETSSSHGGVTSAGAVPVPQLPRLQENVCNSMFFC
ncbi:protein argonaute 4 isoform X2 [Quercus robur]|uniref:protein argonaute 4 isoform X2 n=1 Tax=Quercus robur TaxID=38942 RepID=UPI002163CF4C|nr:protein argonaute 4 isoform X2 [Quercus robur]